MNLKESFRYQTYLDTIMHDASNSINNRNHSLIVTKNHLRNKANPEAENMTEEVDNGVFFKNDDVVKFMQLLVSEKDRLSRAIGAAKASCEIDIDAAIETNKFRQLLRRSIDGMLQFVAANRIECGTDRKFNVEGNQIPYTYDVEVEYIEGYNRDEAKTVAKEIIGEADNVSREIDLALINTVVLYEPPFDIHDSFEDAMTIFLAK